MGRDRKVAIHHSTVGACKEQPLLRLSVAGSFTFTPITVASLSLNSWALLRNKIRGFEISPRYLAQNIRPTLVKRLRWKGHDPKMLQTFFPVHNPSVVDPVFLS